MECFEKEVTAVGSRVCASAGYGRRPTQDECLDTRRGFLRHTVSDEGAHGVSEVASLRDPQVVEHRDYVSGHLLNGICLRVVRLATFSVAASVDEDQAIAALQRIDIPASVPTLQAVGRAVLQYQRRSVALDLVVYGDAVVVDKWHDWHSRQSVGPQSYFRVC